jgi:hypothetical protein
MGGRPRALDEVKRREICALVSTGCGVLGAAHYVGCNPITIRREAARNPEFYEQLRAAELSAQVSPLHAMRKAATTNWRAAAWFLERTQPQAFGPRRPRSFTVEEVQFLLNSFGDVAAEVIRDPDDVLRLIDRLNELQRIAGLDLFAVETPRRDVHNRRMREREVGDMLAASKRKSVTELAAIKRRRQHDGESDDDNRGDPSPWPSTNANPTTPSNPTTNSNN